MINECIYTQFLSYSYCKKLCQLRNFLRLSKNCMGLKLLLMPWIPEIQFLFVCFVALRPKSTAMVMAGRSVHLTTLFPGHA